MPGETERERFNGDGWGRTQRKPVPLRGESLGSRRNPRRRHRQGIRIRELRLPGSKDSRDARNCNLLCRGSVRMRAAVRHQRSGRESPARSPAGAEWEVVVDWNANWFEEQGTLRK